MTSGLKRQHRYSSTPAYASPSVLSIGGDVSRPERRAGSGDPASRAAGVDHEQAFRRIAQAPAPEQKVIPDQPQRYAHGVLTCGLCLERRCVRMRTQQERPVRIVDGRQEMTQEPGADDSFDLDTLSFMCWVCTAIGRFVMVRLPVGAARRAGQAGPL